MFTGNQLLQRHAEQIILKQVSLSALTKINMIMQFDEHRKEMFHYLTQWLSNWTGGDLVKEGSGSGYISKTCS